MRVSQFEHSGHLGEPYYSALTLTWDDLYVDILAKKRRKTDTNTRTFYQALLCYHNATKNAKYETTGTQQKIRNCFAM